MTNDELRMTDEDERRKNKAGVVDNKLRWWLPKPNPKTKKKR